MESSRTITLVAIAAAALLAAGTAVAADDPGVIPLRIEVGEVVSVGPGPVRTLICDDAALVQPTDAGGSPGLRGVHVGTTLCSLTDALSVRRVYRVVVVEPAGNKGPQGSGGSTPKPGYAG